MGYIRPEAKGIILLVIVPLVTWANQLIWNAVAVDLFNAPAISFWQSAGLEWFVAMFWWPLQLMRIGKD